MISPKDNKARFEASFEGFDAVTTPLHSTPHGDEEFDHSDIDADYSFPDTGFSPPLQETTAKVIARHNNDMNVVKNETIDMRGHYGNDGDHDARVSSKRQRSYASGVENAMSPLRTKARGNDLIRHLQKESIELSPALSRRLRDFDFAQRKRKERYGERSPWGIIGLYDHLTGIRTDIEWAEDAAWRREHNEPYLSWSDFEDAKDTGLNQAFFTYIIMFLCTICLVLSIGVNDWKVEPLTVNPMIGPSAQTLIEVGAKKTSLIVNENQWYRLFSPMVLHAGIIHFVLNMLALWFIGYAVEQSHGFINVAILFIVPAVGGTIMSALFLPEYISVGASGGIFGLIGACLADIVTNWNLLFSKAVNKCDDGSRYRHIKVLVWLILDILLNVLIGMTPFVDNFTHVGGMIYGFLCGLSKLERLSTAFFGVQKPGFFMEFRQNLVRFFGMILSIICIVISVILLARSNGERIANCRGCRYVSCVPFPFWSSYDNKWWYCDDCDLVTADARQNRVTGTYSIMNMTCPDGTIESIDLSASHISDSVYLQRQLPSYCRDYCENLFLN